VKWQGKAAEAVGKTAGKAAGLLEECGSACRIDDKLLQHHG
jgi:hypothetical protein